jgi:predicted transglutaminase-like cysteine proteinase
MFKILFILALFFSSTLAEEFYINPYYLNKLKKDSKSYIIIEHYVNFLNKIKDEDDKTKIQKINSYINKIVPKYDNYNYKNDEYWATPFEFFSNAGGDCEDYTIAKMYSLKLLGINPKIMYMSAVKDKYTGGNHMVLSLRIDKNKPPLILDNLSSKVLSLDKRVDLKLMFIFNKEGFFKLKNHQYLVKIGELKLSAYEKYKKKYKNKLILSR